MSVALTPRDIEILRTLLRVRLLSTAMIQAVFFPQLRIARRRMNTLENRGFVTRSRRGMPAIHGGPGRYAYWRLTNLGLDFVTQAHPQEPVADNLVLRASRASLRNFEHRDATSEIYTSLIASRSQDVDEIRSRADRIGWRSEFDEILEYRAVEHAAYVERSIVPDSILETAAGRYFLELDRSTESLSRVSGAMKAYSAYVDQGRYEGQFGDRLRPLLVYVTRSRRRARNLQALADREPRALVIVCRPFADAVGWLAAAVESEKAKPPSLEDSPDVRALIGELYTVAHEAIGRRIEGGELTEAPPFLQAAYDFLSRAPEEP